MDSRIATPLSTRYNKEAELKFYFSRVLKEERHKCDLPLDDVAESIGISDERLLKIESGEFLPSLAELHALCIYYNITVSLGAETPCLMSSTPSS